MKLKNGESAAIKSAFNRFAVGARASIESLKLSIVSGDAKFVALEEANATLKKQVDELVQTMPRGGTRDMIHDGNVSSKERQFLNDQVRHMLSFKPGDDVTQEKALQIGIGASGGFLVPTVVEAEIINKARMKSVFMSNATKIDNAPLSGKTFRQDGVFSWSATAELAQPTETSFASFLKQIAWSLKKQGAFASISNDLIAAIAFDIMGWLTEEAGISYAAKADDWYVNGDGFDQPRGLRIAENVNSSTQAGTNFDWPDLLTLEAALPVQYRSDAVFIFNDDLRGLLVNIQETTGRPMFESAVELKKLGLDTNYKNQSGMLRLPGVTYPFYIVTTTAIPSTLGTGSDETEMWLTVPRMYRIWNGAGMEMSSDSAGANWRIGQTQIKFEVSSDGTQMQGEAAAKQTGVK